MTKRVLAQVTVSFLLGITGACYGSLWIYVIWAAGMIGLGCLHYRQCRQFGQQGRCGLAGYYVLLILHMAVCLLSYFLGHMRYDRQQQVISSVEAYLSQETEATVVGTIYKKEEKNQNIIYYLKHSYIIHENDYQTSNQILIYQNTDACSIGDTILVTGACEGFRRACNEGNFDEKEYYYSKNILFRVEAGTVRILGQKKFPWQEKLYQLRKRIQEVYNQQLPEKEAGVLGVMTLGEKSMLESEIKKLYQQSGISHVLAISGLHVSILGMSIYRFLRKRRISYISSGVLAGLLVFAFGQISGMELSTSRAVLMFLVMLLGNVMGMAYDSVTALSLSALLQLWENPLVFRNTGFLFSYSAVLAVVVAAKILQGRNEAEDSDKEKGKLIKWKKEIGSTLFTSGCIQLVTLPLTVYFYYEFPVYSIFINGLLLPFMGLLLISGILGGLFGILAGTGGVLSGILGSNLTWLLLQSAEWLLKWNEWICGLFQKLPGAMWITGKPPMEMMIGYYVVLVSALLIIHRMKVKEGNDSKEIFVRKVGKTAALSMVVIALLVLLTVRPEKQYQVCFLDVGQGEGIYMQAEDGTVFFLDGGSTSESRIGEYRILSFLKCRGVNHVDGWFVSHADEDHISGLLEVWESGYRIDNLFLAEKIVHDESWEELCAMAEAYGTRIVYLEPGDTVGAGELNLTCLFPWEEETDKNAASLVLKLECPGMSGIFAGDISVEQEQKLLQQYPDLQVDLYKAAHHGSNNSNSEAFLQQLSPVVTVISCGEDNSYGHPGEEAVERIESSGSTIFYTMKSGQITVGCDKGGIWVKEYKESSY